MALPDVELVAAEVHAAWVAAKKKQGVYSRKNETTGEEQMRPYAELSESVKDLDRAMVKAVYRAIEKLSA
jgi:hypothetical protein